MALGLRDPALGLRAALRLSGPIAHPVALLRRAHRFGRPDGAHGHGGGRAVLLAAFSQQQSARAPPREPGSAVVRAAPPRPRSSTPGAALRRLRRGRTTVPNTPRSCAGAPAGLTIHGSHALKFRAAFKP